MSENYFFSRRVPLVEQEQLTPPKHMSSSLVFSGIRVYTQSLALCVCVVDRCLSFFLWTLCCLSFFDLPILITPLVSSNSSFSTDCCTHPDKLVVLESVIHDIRYPSIRCSHPLKHSL